MPTPMSCGPAIAATRRRAPAEQVGHRRLGSAGVVGVDAAHLIADDLDLPARLATEDDRQAPLGQQARQRVVAVQGHQQHAVDVLAGQVVLDPVPLGLGLGHRQPQLERRLDAASS